MKVDETKIKDLIEKVKASSVGNKLDLSAGEDLSVGVMNLISIEEHLFYSSMKTKNKKGLDLLNEVRIMRTELMKDLVTDPQGEEWCLSKHLLAASMRIMEVGTKELKKGNKDKAWELFEKSYKLYSLFWGINLKITSLGSAKSSKNEDMIALTSDTTGKASSASVFDKLGVIVKKVIDCCRE